MREFFVATDEDGMYVQEWSPAQSGGPDRRMILVHGGSHTGVVWSMRLDGEPSWVEYFTASGWTVYVVDWPGVGRSGQPDDYLTMPIGRVTAALRVLLDQVGPAIIMGHSMGGAMAFTMADESFEGIEAIVALAPAPLANAATHLPNVPVAPLDRPVRTSRDAARLRFTNSVHFPQERFDEYYRTLVAYGPALRNAAVGANDGFRVQATDWAQQVPILLLGAEEDKTTLCEDTAAFLGIKATLLGRDWGMPGHAHLFPIEKGNLEIARKIAHWIEELPRR